MTEQQPTADGAPGTPTPRPGPPRITCVKCRKDGLEYITTYDDCIADGGEIVDKEVPCPVEVLQRLGYAE